MIFIINIKGAVFDMDGTLLDSMEIWESVGSDYISSLGITPEAGLREILRPLSLLQAAQYFKMKYELTLSENEIMDGMNNMIKDYYFDLAPVKPDVIKFLSKLKKSGVKMCVATATDRFLTEAALKRCGLIDFFEKIFTVGEVGIGKDSPDIFIKALKFLGTPIEETWIFEDAYYAVHTAKNAGFPVCAVYDRFAVKQADVIMNIADFYAVNYVEIINFFVN